MGSERDTSAIRTQRERRERRRNANRVSVSHDLTVISRCNVYHLRFLGLTLRYNDALPVFLFRSCRSLA